MHLCIDARMYRASGIGTYLQNLLPALTDVFQITLIGSPTELTSVTTSVLPTPIAIYSVSEIAHLPHLIPSCDVFWSPHYNIPILPIRADKRLVTIHDVFHLAHLRTLSLKQKAYATLMIPAATRLSDRIITVSEFSKSEIIKYTRTDPKKVTVIYNGVNLQHFHPNYNDTQKEKIVQKYQLPANYMLYVGNVKPHKNLITLLEAYEQIVNDIPHKMVIVGKKDGFITSDHKLQDKIQNSDSLKENVFFSGFVDGEDLPVIYAMADLFVFPSLYEGFGLPPLEAMACGCPTLTSDRASMPEICGNATTYFNPEDTNELSRKIVQLLSLPVAEKQDVIRRGMERAATFTWESSIRQHLSIIQSLQ